MKILDGFPYSISPLSMKILDGFLSNFGWWLSCVISSAFLKFFFFVVFLKRKAFRIFTYFSAFVKTWNPMRVKVSKRYPELTLTFLVNSPHKSTVLGGWNFELRFFKIFFEEISHTKYGETTKQMQLRLIQLCLKGAIVKVLKFGRLGKWSMHTGYLWHIRSVWGHSVHVRFSKNFLSNWLVEQNTKS